MNILINLTSSRTYNTLHLILIPMNYTLVLIWIITKGNSEVWYNWFTLFKQQQNALMRIFFKWLYNIIKQRSSFRAV